MAGWAERRVLVIKVMSSGVYCVEDWGCRVAYVPEAHLDAVIAAAKASAR